MSFPIRVGLSPKLRIRGVISKRFIRKGGIIEVCPMLVVPRKEEKLIEKTILKNYYFEWDKNNISFLLGMGSLYNHSYSANAELDEDHKNNLMTITAVKNIKKGEEITINYNGYPNMKSPVLSEYLNFDKN